MTQTSDTQIPLPVPDELLLGGAVTHANLLEFTHDAIIVWELGGRGIVYWNRAASQLYGYTREQALGKITHHLLQTQLPGGTHELETTIARHSIWEGELRHMARDGRRLIVQSRIALLAHANGRWLVLEVNRDITTQRQVEATLRQTQFRYGDELSQWLDQPALATLSADSAAARLAQMLHETAAAKEQAHGKWTALRLPAARRAMQWMAGAGLIGGWLTAVPLLFELSPHLPIAVPSALLALGLIGVTLLLSTR